jgi:hypothetical protein
MGNPSIIVIKSGLGCCVRSALLLLLQGKEVLPGIEDHKRNKLIRTILTKDFYWKRSPDFLA